MSTLEQDFPRRVFLDGSCLQNIQAYGEFIFDGAALQERARIHRVPHGFEDLEALRVIFAIGQRAPFELALSEGSFSEVTAKGDPSYPPMNETMNMTLLEVDCGRAVFQGIPLPEHYNPLGTVHGGWFAMLLDSAMGCAVQTTLPPGRSYTTAGLNVNIVRPASHTTGPLRAIGAVIHCGRQIVTAEARIEDERGRLHAHATATCFLLEVPTGCE